MSRLKSTLHLSQLLLFFALFHRIDSAVDTNLGEIFHDPVFEDSDDLLLYRNTSTLPIDVGSGLFARYDLPANVILCEPRGPLIQTSHFIEATKKFRDRGESFPNPYDKALEINGPNGEELQMITTNICGYFNDCIHIVGKMFTLEEFIQFELRKKQLSCYEGFDYNAQALGLGSKVFITTSRPILAGEEIFYPYSWSYWRPYVRLLMNGEVYRYLGTVNENLGRLLKFVLFNSIGPEYDESEMIYISVSGDLDDALEIKYVTYVSRENM